MKGISTKNVIVCEHIVEGLGGKHTLINVMAGTILVERFPAKIPIAFYLEFISPEEHLMTANIDIRLGRKSIASGSAEVQFKENESSVVSLPTALMTVDEPTKLRVLLGWNEEKPKTLLTKTFNQGPVSKNRQQ